MSEQTTPRFEKADRLKELPPYLFVEIDNIKKKALAERRDVIDLGIGDPDLPTPRFIIEKMHSAIESPKNHRYPLGRGLPEFLQQAASFVKKRFGVAVDAKREILTTIGAKDGIAHLPLAVVNPGETVLVPQPGYPVYQAASVLAGAKVAFMELTEQAGYLPQLEQIDLSTLASARLMFLNYPNNPTAATAGLEFFEEAVAFARKHNVILAQDAAYSEVYFDQPPCSIMQVAGAKDVAVEFHSLSKTFNMTGWRLGFIIGNADVLDALAQVKSNCDSGQFNAIQWAGMTALANPDHIDVRARLDIYRERRDALVGGLRKLGWNVAKPQATFYVWIRCPQGIDSMTAAKRLLEEADVVVIPGIGFGRAGEGYLRAALTVDVGRIRQAVERISRLDW